jgi:hypothetical protein
MRALFPNLSFPYILPLTSLFHPPQNASQQPFSGDTGNPYGEVILPPSASGGGFGLGFSDFDYHSTQQVTQQSQQSSYVYQRTEPASFEALQQHHQQFQSPASASNATRLFDGPATQLSQNTTQSSQN